MKKQKITNTKTRPRFRVLRNLRPSTLLLVIPIAVGILTIGLIGTGVYVNSLSDLGARRLITENADAARQVLLAKQPVYARQYAYYQVKNGQSVESLAEYFGVSAETLKSLNPGIIAAGTTIKVPPLEQPLEASDGSNGRLSSTIVTEENGMLRVQQRFDAKQQVITTIPELSTFLASYNAIEKIGPTHYRITRPLTLVGDIRIDITSSTVTKLELTSTPSTVTCLCFDRTIALIDGVEISSVDPATNQPDDNIKDGRAFVRMKNGRMDILNSKLDYLGNGIDIIEASSPLYTTQKDGGMYGVSWRISGDTLGKELTTGWVENSNFEHNYFGSYTYGASGMTWKGNTFFKNHVYGLDPHDDSNNAMIEDNKFIENGKHGFIVSKRCNYNIIRNNISIDNTGHGYMLHQDSAYNLIENNIAKGNMDNFVIYESNFNTIIGNTSYSPHSSHVRINQSSFNNYIVQNDMVGGNRGIFLYGNVQNTYIADNTIQNMRKKIQTMGANNTIFANNTVDNLVYDIDEDDRMIYGLNTVKKLNKEIPSNESIIDTFNK